MHTNIPNSGLDAFYFGTAGKPLFGIYHAPQYGPFRDCGVVLCYPMGQEYIRAHRTYRQLAVRLCTAGFPVLRFDLYGCGDSSGDCEQGQIGQWLADLSSAVEAITARGNLVNICLVGLRLGGTLAAMAGATRGNIDGLVLWDPVINGKAYVEELLRSAAPPPRLTTENDLDLSGFPLTHTMRTDLEHIDLLTMHGRPAHHILLIDSHQEAREDGFQTHLKQMGAHVEDHYLPSPQIWLEAPYRLLVPLQILHLVVSWISEVYR
jgi:uncharacterized protein